jgi:hypothetical protein
MTQTPQVSPLQSPDGSEPARATSPRQVSTWRSNEAVVVRLTILIILYATAARMLLLPVTDLDIWWHLRAGHWIVENGGVPSTDPFSTFGQDKAWIAYSWLFEVLAYGFYRWLGLAGVVVLRMALALAVLAAVHRLVARREPSFVRGTALVTLAFVALLPLLRERSWLFSILFYTLTLDAVLEMRAGQPTRGVFWLPLLYASWANLHIQFVNGLFLLGLACVAPVLDRCFGLERSGKHADTAGTRGWWALVGVTGLCVLATLLNPYGLRLYAAVIELPTQAVPFKVISELQAIPFRHLTDWAPLALVGLAVFMMGWGRKLSSFEILLLIASAILSFRAMRDVWLVVLAALAILAPYRKSPSLGPAKPFALTRWRALVVAGGVAVLLTFGAWSYDLSESHLQKQVAEHFPMQAAGVVEQHAWAGPLFNGYEWGGYLIWRLPDMPVSMDGRTSVHGDERLLRSWQTWNGLPGWDTDPELAAAGVVIADPQRPLTSLLRLDPRFTLVHEDDVAAVFVAKNANPVSCRSPQRPHAAH